MFKFDASQLTVEYRKLKSVTTALGGSITLVDEEKSTPEVEEYIRIPIPFAVARKFVQITKMTKYLKPVTICILRYNDLIVNIERDLATNIRDHNPEVDRWVANIDLYVNKNLAAKLEDHTWYFDGRYVFRIDEQILRELREGGDLVTYLNEAETFRFAQVQCIDLYNSNIPVMSCGILHDLRDVLAFSSGECFAVTPPIWNNVTAIGSAASQDVAAGEHEDFIDSTDGVTAGETRIPTLFDQVDTNYALNLNFTLNSAKAISTVFGYDSIEPLQLPEVMLQLLTVNIPSLPRHVKSTFDIGLLPSYGIIWLMGLLTRTTTLDDYIKIRACIKYLTTKGMFRRASTKKSKMYVTGDFQLPPLVTVD